MIGKHLVDKLYNDELREDTVFGAFACELTGRQLPDDKMYIEVKLPGGDTVFARMCFSFPLVAMPSKEWIDAYKDTIYGWITFEQGLPEKPILIGFTFQEGKEHNVDSFPDSATLIGINYQITIDDLGDRLELKQLTGNQQEIVITTDSVYIKSDNINLGQDVAAEPAVLGDTLEKLLNDLIDIIKTAKVTTSLGPQPLMPDTQAKIAALLPDVATIKSQINKLS